MLLTKRNFLSITGASVIMLAHGSVNQNDVDLNLRAQPLRGVDATTIAGRTQVDPATVAGAVHIIFVGQSTNSNALQGVMPTPIHGDKIFNLSIGHKGSVFVAKNPLMSSDIVLGHHGFFLADSLISEGLAEKVLLTNIICGGNYFSDWVGSGELAYRIGLAARCIARSGLTGLKTIIDHQGGEWDSDAGVTQTAATNSLNAIITEFKRVGLLRAGNVMLVNRNTRITNSSTLRNPVRAAQAAVVDGNIVRAGADIDSLGSSFRHDGTHFTVAGGQAQANLKLPAYRSFLSA